MKETYKNDIDFLLEAIISLKDKESAFEFLSDLCTHNEIESMAQRLTSAKLLMQGMTYDQIVSETEISSATLSRVSKCVKYGEGYKKTLGSMKTTLE